ncbi:hypothetical protein C8Q79DRAFT_981791 [Trametes meyenii]|nr:hypothetical protein C8Q79DRAFT_981791 [Trametes meyenii]
MDVLFLSNHPLESTVVDAATGEVVYTINTPFNLGSRTTTVRDAHGKHIAELNLRSFGHDRVQLYGETRNVSEWLPRDGIFTSSRRLVAPDGRCYVWKKRMRKSHFTLLDCQTNQVVVETHGASFRGMFSGNSRKMGLHVSPEVTPIMDVIVLSFIYCEKKRRDTDKAAAASTA